MNSTDPVNASPRAFGPYLLSFFAVITTFVYLGQLPRYIHLYIQTDSMHLAQYLTLEEQMDLMGKNVFLIYMFMPFVLALGVLILCHRYLLGKTVLSLFTSRTRFDAKRFFTMFFLWMFINLCFVSYAVFTSPDIQSDPQWTSWFGLLGICLVFVPVQIAFEEAFFRGFLADMIRFRWTNRWVVVCATALLFALMHAGNPEVSAIGPIIMLYYLALGVFLGILAIFDRGLELPMGFHYANNLVGLLIISSSWGALPTDALFIDDAAPSFGFFNWLEIGVVLPAILLIFRKIYRWK